MSQIVDWEYYSSLHNKVTETDFEKAEALAEKDVKLVVGFPRWNALDSEAWYYEQLKDCICNVIDKMTEMQSSANNTESHRRLWDKEDEQDLKLNNHETRLSVLEKERK